MNDFLKYCLASLSYSSSSLSMIPYGSYDFMCLKTVSVTLTIFSQTSLATTIDVNFLLSIQAGIIHQVWTQGFFLRRSATKKNPYYGVGKKKVELFKIKNT